MLKHLILGMCRLPFVVVLDSVTHPISKHAHFSCIFSRSESFIQAAMAMQKDRKISFNLPMEGDMHEPVTAILPAESTSTNTINFFVGDACNMPPPDRLGTFDAILCSNLLCRLPDPMALLNALPDYLNIGGVVLFVSPYSWLEEYTPRNKWIGGCTNEIGTAVNSKQRLREIMEARGFALVHDEAVPLVIREHARKYQYIISDATGWRRVK